MKCLLRIQEKEYNLCILYIIYIIFYVNIHSTQGNAQILLHV